MKLHPKVAPVCLGQVHQKTRRGRIQKNWFGVGVVFSHYPSYIAYLGGKPFKALPVGKKTAVGILNHKY